MRSETGAFAVDSRTAATGGMMMLTDSMGGNVGMMMLTDSMGGNVNVTTAGCTVNSWTAHETLAVWYDFTTVSSSGISGSRSNSADTCASVYSFLITSGSIGRLEIPTRGFCPVKGNTESSHQYLYGFGYSSPTVQVGD